MLLIKRIRLGLFRQDFSCTSEIYWTLRGAHSELKCMPYLLFHVHPASNLLYEPPILAYNELLIVSILQPVLIPSAGTGHFSRLCDWGEPGKKKHRGASDAGVVDALSEGLCAYVHMDQDCLGPSRHSRAPISHRYCNHLGGACDDPKPGIRSFPSALDNSLYQIWMVGPEIEETCCYTSLENGKRDKN